MIIAPCITKPLAPAITRAITQAGAGGGAPVAPAFIAPANQSIFTVSVANTITTDEAATITADGVGIGSTSPSLSWTPGSIDRDVDLVASANGLDSEAIKVAVCEANTLSTVMTGWTATNVTITGSQSDYLGGTNAYRILASAGTAQHHASRTPSPAPSGTMTSFEMKVKAGTADKVLVYFPTSVSNRRAQIDLTTGQAYCDRMSIKVVEDLGGGWKRLWGRILDGVAATAIRVYPTTTLDGNNSITAAGTETIFAMEPRMTGGPLPMTNYQQCGFRRAGSTAYGADHWIVNTPFNSTVADMANTTSMFIDVLVPTTYSTSNQYRVVYLMPVEAGTGTTLNNELEEIEALGLHDSMDCIFVRPCFLNNRTWGGVKNDGTINHDAYISDMLPGFLAEFYSVIDTREGRTLFGYSAGGVAAFTQFQRRPDVWGYCVAWDSPWDVAYGTYDEAQHFGTEAQYNLFAPYQHVDDTKTGWNDKCRLIIGGAATFGTPTTNMFSLLTTELGASKNGTGDYDTTITNASGKWWRLYKDQTGIGSPAHDFLPEWVTPAAAALELVWAA